MNAHKAAALRTYARRNRLLASLGFVAPKGSGLTEYDVYLASPLWAEIRERKLASQVQNGLPVCFACGKPANQVHHGDYEIGTLVGPPIIARDGKPFSDDANPESHPWVWARWLETANLYVVCKPCHEWAEKILGEPLGPATATRRLKNRRRKNKLDEAVPRAARQGRQERKAREMESELNRLLERDENVT